MLINQLCFSGFSLDPLDMGELCPPPPDKCRRQSVNMGIHEGGGT